MCDDDYGLSVLSCGIIALLFLIQYPFKGYPWLTFNFVPPGMIFAILGTNHPPWINLLPTARKDVQDVNIPESHAPEDGGFQYCLMQANNLEATCIIRLWFDNFPLKGHFKPTKPTKPFSRPPSILRHSPFQRILLALGHRPDNQHSCPSTCRLFWR